MEAALALPPASYERAVATQDVFDGFKAQTGLPLNQISRGGFDHIGPT